MNKGDVVNYVLVCDIIPGNKLIYYSGYFKLHKLVGNKKDAFIMVPECTDKYQEAMKLCFKDEANKLCKKVNENSIITKFHVEEHKYI